jgi:hypothetical protein
MLRSKKRQLLRQKPIGLQRRCFVSLRSALCIFLGYRFDAQESGKAFILVQSGSYVCFGLRLFWATFVLSYVCFGLRLF